MFRVTFKRGYDRVVFDCPYLKDVKAMVDTVVPFLADGTEFVVEVKEDNDDDKTNDAV